MLDRRLFHHLVYWLGQWPAGHPYAVVGSTRRSTPGWDGKVHGFVGVGSPDVTMLSVPPERVSAVRALSGDGLEDLLPRIPGALGLPEQYPFRGIFRYTAAPTPLPDRGEWEESDAAGLPEWLRPFGSPVLVVRAPETGDYLAGVGLKRHGIYGHEIAVGTTPEARGRGLARHLAAQAARRVLDEGAIPLYLHAPHNIASARVAEAAGFADRGWSFYGLPEE
jgi:GNAT superfamily N-acetyltransferase